MFELIETKDASEFLKKLAESPYKLYIDDHEFVYIEYYTEKIRYNLARRFMRFSTDSALVYMTYKIVFQIEIDNLKHIIEGLRYGEAPSQIETMADLLGGQDMAIEEMILLNMTFDRTELDQVLFTLKDSKYFYPQPASKIVNNVKGVHALAEDNAYTKLLDRLIQVASDMKLDLSNDLAYDRTLQFESYKCLLK